MSAKPPNSEPDPLKPRHKMPSRGAVQGVRDDMKEAREAGIGMTVNSVSRYTHNFLNHKPWHPLNFSVMARLYEKEQEHIQREKARIRGEEEFRAEQEKMATLAMLPTEQAERLRAAQSISFMYTKPPGYDAMVEREKKKAEAERQKKEEGGAVGDAAADRGDKAGPSRAPAMPVLSARDLLAAREELARNSGLQFAPDALGMLGQRPGPGADADMLLLDPEELAMEAGAGVGRGGATGGVGGGRRGGEGDTVDGDGNKGKGGGLTLLRSLPRGDRVRLARAYRDLEAARGRGGSLGSGERQLEQYLSGVGVSAREMGQWVREVEREERERGREGDREGRRGEERSREREKGGRRERERSRRRERERGEGDRRREGYRERDRSRERERGGRRDERRGRERSRERDRRSRERDRSGRHETDRSRARDGRQPWWAAPH